MGKKANNEQIVDNELQIAYLTKVIDSLIDSNCVPEGGLKGGDLKKLQKEAVEEMRDKYSGTMKFVISKK